MAAPIIIVGQGIAGSLLSWELLQRNIPVLVYDPSYAQSATYHASGIINPITGKRFVKTWLADTLLPHATSTYQALEEALQIQCYSPLPMYKILNSIKEQNDYMARTQDESYAQYLSDEISYIDSNLVHNPYGAFAINGGGKLDTHIFLAAYRQYLKTNSLLIEQPYTEQQAINSEQLVIFCTGYEARANGLFASLAWQIVKGEYLLVRIEGLDPHLILSGDTTLSPTTEYNIYYAGATYQWHYATSAPTPQYRAEVIESLDQMLALPYQVLYHGAAIRPAVRHRRPFLGFHSEYPHIGIFNGMGTKGISIAPYFASHLASHIADGIPLLDQVNINMKVLA